VSSRDETANAPVVAKDTRRIKSYDRVVSTSRDHGSHKSVEVTTAATGQTPDDLAQNTREKGARKKVRQAK
jgi:hypothetical protein